MNGKIVGTGIIAFGLGALVGWAITADRFEHRMKANQKLLGDRLARKEAQVADLERKLMEPPPWEKASRERVSEAAKATAERLASEPDGFMAVEDVADGAVIVSEIDSEFSPGGEDGENSDEGDKEALASQRRSMRRNIDTILADYAANPDDRDVLIERIGRVTEADKNEAPIIISQALYASDPDEGDLFSKITLQWYDRERILVDDEEEVIDTPYEYIGNQALNNFGNESGNADVVFVRNRRMLTDFEVERVYDDPPAHVRYGLGKEEFRVKKAAGYIQFDDD